MKTLLVLVVLLVPASARAFDDHARYDASTLLGGGGGRYFTGSVRDGFTCSVCHTGGPVPDDARVDPADASLLVDGYRPGVGYEIDVALPGTAASSVALEVVDAAGRGAGTLALISDPLQTDEDKCSRGPGMEPATAAHLVELPAGSRQVAVVDVCGAARLRVTWTAPAVSIGGVWLNAAIVGGDGSGSPVGDGVLVFERAIPSVGDVAEPGRVTSACTAAPGSDPSEAWLALLVGVICLRARPRRQ